MGSNAKRMSEEHRSYNMRRDLLIVAIVVVAVAVIGVILLSHSGPVNAQIASVETEKDLYHSDEIMNITVEVTSTGNLDNATLMIEGIQDKHGRTRLSHEMQVNLTSGVNNFTYDYQLPECSSCAGLNAGTYQVNVTLTENGTVISNATKSVEIQQ
jgi:hypothetical protein